MYRSKLFRAETKVLDGNRIEAVLSTEAPDREGDVIIQRYWDLTNFLKHPVLLSSHDYGSLRSQIGEWEDVTIKGKRLVGIARYYVDEGNDEADWGYKLAVKGRAAYSVGFLPNMEKAKELPGGGFFPSYEFRGQELLETSQVTVPANPEALQRMKGLTFNPVVDALVGELLGDEPASETPDLLDALKAHIDLRFEELRGMLVPTGGDASPEPTYIERFIAAHGRR